MEGGQQHFLPVAAETGSGLLRSDNVWGDCWMRKRGYPHNGVYVPKKDGTPKGYLFLGSVSGEVGVDPAKLFRDHPTNYQLVGGIKGKEIHVERDNNGGSERWH
jgi:hypothetical protein